MSIMQLTQTIHIIPSSAGEGSRTTPVSSGEPMEQPTLPGLGIEEDSQPMVTNRQIAQALASVADLLEAQYSNPYRIQAYRNAARGVLELGEAAAVILARGEELPIAGLGRRLRSRIKELVETGAMTFYDDLCMQSLPVGVRRLMAVDHVGPRTAIRLYEELAIDTPEKLWFAAQQQRIRGLHGFGKRSEARLKDAVARLLEGSNTYPLDGAA
jgi:DNA polymerase/3'-5' exonuclease PolX